MIIGESVLLCEFIIFTGVMALKKSKGPLCYLIHRCEEASSPFAAFHFQEKPDGVRRDQVFNAKKDEMNKLRPCGFLCSQIRFSYFLVMQQLAAQALQHQRSIFQNISMPCNH